MLINLKAFLKNSSPVFLMDIYRSFKPKPKPKPKYPFLGLNTKEVFSKIYEDSYWRSGDSISGSGSDHLHTNTIKRELEKVISRYEIKSFLDAPCGDFNWMQEVNLQKMKYVGVDIVDHLIQENIAKYSGIKNLEFQVKNIIEDQLPQADLILCRDCLVHLSFADIKLTLENYKKSQSTYLLTTTFIKRTENKDINTGDWRPLNLQASPFNLPEPLLIIDENCTEGDGKYCDKMLALWKLSDIT